MHLLRTLQVGPNECSLFEYVSFTLYPALFEIYNNSFTGDLNALVCDTTTGLKYTQAAGFNVKADCAGVNPELDCSCCNECCDDLTGCPSDTVEGICEYYASSSNNIYPGVSRCECVSASSRQNDAGNDAPFDDNGTGSYEMKCNMTPWCRYCSDDSDCAIQTNGYVYDEFGEQISEWRRFEYLPGSNYEGRVVTLTFDKTNTCKVYVDGNVCNDCSVVLCFDAFQTLQVDCENISGGASFSSCSTTLDSLNRFGVLQVLHQNFEYDYSWTDGNICKVNHEGFCEVLGAAIENHSFRDDGYVCECNESGLALSCLQEECIYCLDGVEGEDCFFVGLRFFFQEGSFVSLGYVLDYIFLTSEDTINTLVFYSILDDGTCSISAGNDECTSCNNVVCPGDDAFASPKLQFDCENVFGEGAKYDPCTVDVEVFNNTTTTNLPHTLQVVLSTAPANDKEDLDSLPQCIPYNVPESVSRFFRNGYDE